MEKPHSRRGSLPSFSVRTAKRRPSIGSRRGSTIGRISVGQLQIHSCLCLNISLVRVQENELPLTPADSAVLSEVFGPGAFAGTLEKKTIQQPTLVAVRPLGVGPMGIAAGGGVPKWHLFRCINCQLDVFAISLSLSLSTLTLQNPPLSSSPTSPGERPNAATPFVAVLNPRLKHGDDVVRLDESCSKAFGILIKRASSTSESSGPLSPLSPHTPEPSDPGVGSSNNSGVGVGGTLRKSSSVSSPTHSSSLTSSQSPVQSGRSTTSPSGTQRQIAGGGTKVPSPTQRIRNLYAQASQASHQAKLAMEARISEFTALQLQENREFERRLRAELGYLTELVHELSDDRHPYAPIETFVEGFSPRSKSMFMEGVQDNKSVLLAAEGKERSPRSALDPSPKGFGPRFRENGSGIDFLESDGDLVGTDTLEEKMPTSPTALTTASQLSLDQTIERLNRAAISPKHETEENHPPSTEATLTGGGGVGVGVGGSGLGLGLGGVGVGVGGGVGGRPKVGGGAPAFQLPALIESEKEPEEKPGSVVVEKRPTVEEPVEMDEDALDSKETPREGGQGDGLFRFDEELESQSPKHFLKEDLPLPDETEEPDSASHGQTSSTPVLSKRSIPIRSRAASSATSDEMKKHRLSSSLPIQIPKAAFSLRTGGAHAFLLASGNGSDKSGVPSSYRSGRSDRENPDAPQRVVKVGRSGSSAGLIRPVLGRNRSNSGDLSSSLNLKKSVIGRPTASKEQEEPPSPLSPKPSSRAGIDDDEPDESQFVPPHTLTQEPFWSFAKVKYVATEHDSKRRHSIAGGVTSKEGEGQGGGQTGLNRPYRAGSDAGVLSLKPNLRANLAGLPAPSLPNSRDLGIGIRAQPPYNTVSGSLLLPRNSLQSSLTRALSSTSTTSSNSTASSRTASPVPG